MPRVVEVSPSPPLRSFVRAYHYTELTLGDADLVMPVTARPELMLQFGLRRPFGVVDRRTGERTTAPDVVLVGRQTQRNFDLSATGEVTTFTVHFQPAGLHRLFHIPASELTNQAVTADGVLDSCITDLHARVAEAPCLASMIRHVEDFLMARVDKCRPFHPVQACAVTMLENGAREIGALAAACDLSIRQFERVFTQQVGVGPKLFARVIRFTQTLQAKIDNPQLTWAGVATAAGYYDQTHWIRDCHTFGADSPTALLQNWIDCRP